MKINIINKYVLAFTLVLILGVGIYFYSKPKNIAQVLDDYKVEEPNVPVTKDIAFDNFRPNSNGFLGSITDSFKDDIQPGSIISLPINQQIILTKSSNTDSHALILNTEKGNTVIEADPPTDC